MSVQAVLKAKQDIETILGEKMDLHQLYVYLLPRKPELAMFLESKANCNEVAYFEKFGLPVSSMDSHFVDAFRYANSAVKYNLDNAGLIDITKIIP